MAGFRTYLAEQLIFNSRSQTVRELSGGRLDNVGGIFKWRATKNSELETGKCLQKKALSKKPCQANKEEKE